MSRSDAPRLAMVAGEVSGDLLAGLLLDGVRQRWPAARAAGIGGPQMQQRGFEAWWPSERLSVFGYVEVLRHYRGLLAVRNQLRDRLLRADRPDVFIGVDAPDFNLDLEAALRAGGIPTVHFVSPSFWAWRPERVRKLQRSCDHVLCVFPFEPALLARHGVAASYVGHPLASVIPPVPDRAAARAALGLPDDATVVAILPGSRASEIHQLAALFFEAARRVRQAMPGVRFVVPAVPALRERIVRALAASGVADATLVVDGRSHAVLAACDATLIASGTATLEAALFQRPMVVSYRVNWLTWKIMAPKQLQPWLSLPNILCGEFVVPELMQDRARPQALADELLAWLEPSDAARARVAALRQRFAALHADLRRDTPTLAAEAIDRVIHAADR